MLTNDDLRRSFEELGFVTGSEALLPLLRQAYKAACVSDITVLLEGETGTGKAGAGLMPFIASIKSAGLFPSSPCIVVRSARRWRKASYLVTSKAHSPGPSPIARGFSKPPRGGRSSWMTLTIYPSMSRPSYWTCCSEVRCAPSDLTSKRRWTCESSPHPISRCKPLVFQNRFRADLYHRLNVVRLWLPPLRDRMQDLPNLVLAFAHRHREIYYPIEKVEPELVSFLAVAILSRQRA